MTDELLRRMRRADPAGRPGTTPSSRPSIRDLMEAAMQSTAPTTTRHGSGPDRPRPPRWLPAAAASAALVLGGVAAVALLSDDTSRGPSVPPEPASTRELALPGSDVMHSCVQYSVDVLAQMPTAFSGEVVAVGDGTVLLEVDRWYRGGDADRVALENPFGPMASIDGIEFAEGGRYLVTASESDTVNACGFTAEWSPGTAADFEAAFGG